MKGVATRWEPPIAPTVLERARREILGALARAGAHGAWGADLREVVLSATITRKVYERARHQLGAEGLVEMHGQRTTITGVGRAALAAKAAA